VNKSQLIDALSARFEGNRKQAQHALESVLDTITREVARGEKVAITGFGSFRKIDRKARMVRNPQTGEQIRAKATSVPKFTAGAELKGVVSGAKALPKLTLAASTSTAKKATASAKKAAAKRTTKKATAKKTAKKATPAKKATAKKATKKAPAKKAAKRAPAKKTAAKKSAAKKTTAKKTAKKAPARKAAAKKTAKRTAKKR
jgi:DNA-binding protein HU-beta